MGGQGGEVAKGRHKAGLNLGALPQSSQNKEGVGLSREQLAFSVKGQRVNVLGFTSDAVPVSPHRSAVTGK